jgi:hypothetical protein
MAHQWRAGKAVDTIAVVIISKLPVVCCESRHDSALARWAYSWGIQLAKLRFFFQTRKYVAQINRHPHIENERSKREWVIIRVWKNKLRLGKNKIYFDFPLDLY